MVIFYLSFLRSYEKIKLKRATYRNAIHTQSYKNNFSLPRLIYFTFFTAAAAYIYLFYAFDLSNYFAS